MAASSDAQFTIEFPDKPCGLEVSFEDMNFYVGEKFHSKTAEDFGDIVKGARIIAVGGKSTSGLTMDSISDLFQTATFPVTVEFSSDKVSMAVLRAQTDPRFSLIEENPFGLKGKDEDKIYNMTVQKRPLGFTVAVVNSVPQIVQVDALLEEFVEEGSRVMAINKVLVNDLDEAQILSSLAKEELPFNVTLMRPAPLNMFAEEQDSGMMEPSAYAQGGTLMTLKICWFDTSNGQKDFDLPIRVDASICELRSKVAVRSKLKFHALHLVCKGKQLADDRESLKNSDIKDGDTVRVIVSKRKSAIPEAEQEVSIDVLIKILGAFLITVSPTLFDFMWTDIDCTNSEILHITELDRILARFLGLWERISGIRRKPAEEYEDRAVEFSTTENLGLVIEGNEVIMVHDNTQAKKQGVASGWKIAEVMYENAEGQEIRQVANGRNCLEVLKTTKVGAVKQKFTVLAKAPQGKRHDLLMALRDMAFEKLKLSEKEGTITRKQYSQLPEIFAQGCNRVTFPSRPVGVSIIGAPVGNGAFVNKVTSPAAEGQVKTGAQLLEINNKVVHGSKFNQVIQIFEKATVPLTITFQPPPKPH